jgi:hypothetical protein
MLLLEAKQMFDFYIANFYQLFSLVLNSKNHHNLLCWNEEIANQCPRMTLEEYKCIITDVQNLETLIFRHNSYALFYDERLKVVAPQNHIFLYCRDLLSSLKLLITQHEFRKFSSVEAQQLSDSQSVVRKLTQLLHQYSPHCSLKRIAITHYPPKTIAALSEFMKETKLEVLFL